MPRRLTPSAQTAHNRYHSAPGLSATQSYHIDKKSGCITKFMQNGAVSTGRCNTGLKFTRGSLKAQGFSRTLIEAQSYLVEIGLRVTGQVGLLREVLSQ